MAHDSKFIKTPDSGKLRYTQVPSGTHALLRHTKSGTLRYTFIQTYLVRYTQVHSIHLGTLRYAFITQAHQVKYNQERSGTLRYTQVHMHY